MSVNRLRPCSAERDDNEEKRTWKAGRTQREVCSRGSFGCRERNRRERARAFTRAARLLLLLIPVLARGQADQPSLRIQSIAAESILAGSTPTASTAETVSVDRFAGQDLGAKITAAQASLAGRAATLQIDTAGTIATPATLNAGNSLQIAAAINIAATVTLTGSSRFFFYVNGSS